MHKSLLNVPACYSIVQGYHTAMTPQYALYLEGQYMNTFADKGSAERYAKLHFALNGS